MKLTEYTKKFNNSTIIEENPSLGTQCVALVKHYSYNVLNIPLWIFWNTARNGWLNIENTFKKDLRIKILNNPKDKNQAPPVGAILFFNTWRYWHTSICLENFKWENKLKVFEQNVWNWNWEGYDDRAKISYITYKNIYGWYISKKIDLVWENKILKKELETLNKDFEEYKKSTEWLILNIKKYFTTLENSKKSIFNWF